MTTRHQHDVASRLPTGNGGDIVSGQGNQIMLRKLTNGILNDEVWMVGACNGFLPL